MEPKPMSHPRWRTPFATLLAAALLVGPIAPARAQQDDPIELARKYFEGGKQAYDTGRYDAAIQLFEEARKVSPRASITFALAQAYRRQYVDDKDPAKLKRAVTLFEEYLVETPRGGRREEADRYRSDLGPLLARVEAEARASGKSMTDMSVRKQETQLYVQVNAGGARAGIDGGPLTQAPVIQTVAPGKHKVRVEAEGWFPEEIDAIAVERQMIPVTVTLRERPAQLAIRTLGGATVSVDGRPYGDAPMRPLSVSSGPHFVTVTKRGHHAWTRELTLKRGEVVPIDAPLETTTQRKASYWVMGSAGVLLIAGGVSSVVAYSAQTNAEDLLDQRETGNLTEEERVEYQGYRDKRETWSTRATYLFAGAGAVAVTGALLYFLDSPRVELRGEREAPMVTPTGGPSEVGLAVQGRF